jgi:hypothetical protein
MAGILTVQTIQGPTTGANANKVIIPAGQTLDASAGSVELPAGAGGKVLQVQQTVLSTAVTYSGTGTWHQISGLNTSITPSSTSSKILVTVSINTTDGNNYAPTFHIYRDGSRITPLGDSNSQTGVGTAYAYLAGGSASGAHVYGTVTFSYLHSPSTTSSTTYQVYGAKTTLAVSDVRINPVELGGSSTMTLMEIAG